jgi:hypothetical protein
MLPKYCGFLDKQIRLTVLFRACLQQFEKYLWHWSWPTLIIVVCKIASKLLVNLAYVFFWLEFVLYCFVRLLFGF